MPDVLGEHQFIMLENFDTIFFSTNRTVPFMSQSFIAGLAMLCHFMPNDGSLWGSSLIPSTLPRKLLCGLKLALYTRHKVHMRCCCIETYLLRRLTPKWTHLIVVARVTMFMRNDRILQIFFWMPEAKWRFTTS